MSFQPQQAAYGASGQYPDFQQPGYAYQNPHSYAVNDSLVVNPQNIATLPPLPDQHALYDPLAHAESIQNPPMPEDGPEAPPLPAEDVPPPLPSEDAPPLPVEPSDPSAPSMQLADMPQQQQHPPLYLTEPATSDTARTAQLPSVHTLPSQSWEAYQQPGYEAYPSQQPGWQSDPYRSLYTSYHPSVPAFQQHPWQTQQWQQPQQQGASQQPQAYPPPAHSTPQPIAAEPAAAANLIQQAATKIVTDAAKIFLKPGRATRPKRLAIVLRGLPGSGKSHIAKKLKQVEVEQGGDAPRIHALDDYFVTEVEKEVTEEIAGKTPRKRTHRHMEYCYEAALEDAYKASMLQAFERTVREARFAMVIVDAPNLTVHDLKVYWAAGQQGGYEVFIVEVGGVSAEQCLQRNIHNRSEDDITQAAGLWQPTPPTYPLLDVEGLLGVSKEKAGIAEVEMEAESASEGSQDAEDERHRDAAPRAVSSKWANEAEEQSQKTKKQTNSKRALAQGQGNSKRAKPEPAGTSDYDGLTAGLDGFFGKTQGHRGMRDHAKSTRGVLKKGSSLRGGGTRSVRWADEEPSGQSGFRIGGSQQLETIYVLEGLGPPKEHPPGSKSFRDQIRAEHSAERHAFRDALLGGRRA